LSINWPATRFVTFATTVVAAVATIQCGGSSSPSQASPTSPVNSVLVTGTPPAIGAAAQFTATATLLNGTTQSVTTQSTWGSSNTAVVTVSNSGLVTVIGAGAANVSATYQGVIGSLAIRTGLRIVTVNGAASLVGASTQFSATATFADGGTQDVTTQSTWQSSNTSVVTVTSGLVTAIGAGTASVSATYQGVIGSQNVLIPNRYILSGTAPAAVRGVPQSASNNFSVGQSGGTVTLTLTSAVETLPGGVLNPSVVMGIGVGTPTGTSCTLSTGTAATLLSAGASSSISGTLSPGAYCIQVTNEDASAQTSGPVAYTIVVVSP
jgi:hypothetical protein